jgi:hypothetical protein
MPIIRLLDDRDGKAWFTLIAVGPIQRIPPVEELRYVVSEGHVEMLRKKHIPYEEIKSTTKVGGKNSSTRKKR